MALNAREPTLPNREHNKYIVFGLVSLSLFMWSVDSTIVATALSTIQINLKASLGWMGWVLTIYALVSLTMMPLMGRISDEWGRKRVFMLCMATFTIGSLLCAFSSNIYFLIFSRCIQALGGSGFMPSSVGIVGDFFPKNRARAIGLFTSILPLGGIIGPAIGGWLLAVAPWQTIFLVNLPAGILVLIGSYFLMDGDAAKSRHERIDLAGAGLFSAGLLSLMYYLKQIGDNPRSIISPVNWLILGVGACALIAFWRHESRTPSPVLEIALLQNPTFVVMNSLNLLYGACIFSISALVPYFAQTAYGFSSLASGSLLTARALGMMGMSTVTSMLLDRTGYRLPMATGFILLAASLAGISLIAHAPAFLGGGISDYWWLSAVVFVSGMGIGMASPSSNNAAIELMPDKLAAISGLRGMFRQSGGVLGTSVMILFLSRFSDKAAGFRVVFGAMAIILVLITPLIKAVPDGRNRQPEPSLPTANNFKA